MLLLTLVILAQAPAAPQKPIPADAYANPATADLVQHARNARERNERLVTSYTAKVSQRIGVGIRALSRDRMLYRQELVARISWFRDAPSSIEFIGAREGIPIAMHKDQVPDDLHSEAWELVIDPSSDYLRLIGGEGDDGFIYPLVQGGESDYRYAIGDTTTITLQTGKKVRLVALEITPRRSEFRLLAGTLWFDADTYGLVRAVFRPARPFDLRRDSDPGDMKDVPAFVNAIGDVKFVTLEYGFYENRWWMPRYVAIDATGSMGNSLHVPVRIERIYDDYEVLGGTPPDTKTTFRPAGSIKPQFADNSDSARKHRSDSVKVLRKQCSDSTGSDSTARASACTQLHANDRSERLKVIIPKDTASLMTSTELGPPILDMGDMITESEIRGLKESIEKIPASPWQSRLELPRGLGSLLSHARYNRIEALSVSANGQLDLSRLRFEGLARFGLADRVINGELGLVRATPNGTVRIAAYQRLDAVNPEAEPFGIVNSITSLLGQSDDGDYFRTRGVEIKGENINSGWWNARAYYQRERPAFVKTAVSLPHLFNPDRHFRSNILADSAKELGGALTLRGTKTYSHSFALGGETTLDGATGDFDFARGAATVRAFLTPGGPYAAALTLSAGSSTGPVPVQHRFYLGGANSLRGYPGAIMSGDAFWRARAEVGNSMPAARVILFTDVGWAGNRAEFVRGRPLIGAGIGVSLLDGLVRIDLARGLRAPKGWRLEFYFDGVL